MDEKQAPVLLEKESLLLSMLGFKFSSLMASQPNSLKDVADRVDCLLVIDDERVDSDLREDSDLVRSMDSCFMNFLLPYVLLLL